MQQSLRCWFVAFLAISLALTVARQVFDFIGRLWLCILVNFFQTVALIFALFGAAQLRPHFVVGFCVWTPLWLAWNVFLIFYYLNFGELDRDSGILSFGAGGQNFWVNQLGCDRRAIEQSSLSSALRSGPGIEDYDLTQGPGGTRDFGGNSFTILAPITAGAPSDVELTRLSAGGSADDWVTTSCPGLFDYWVIEIAQGSTHLLASIITWLMAIVFLVTFVRKLGPNYVRRQDGPSVTMELRDSFDNPGGGTGGPRNSGGGDFTPLAGRGYESSEMTGYLNATMDDDPNSGMSSSLKMAHQVSNGVIPSGLNGQAGSNNSNGTAVSGLAGGSARKPRSSSTRKAKRTKDYRSIHAVDGGASNMSVAELDDEPYGPRKNRNSQKRSQQRPRTASLDQRRNSPHKSLRQSDNLPCPDIVLGAVGDEGGMIMIKSTADGDRRRHSYHGRTRKQARLSAAGSSGPGSFVGVGSRNNNTSSQSSRQSTMGGAAMIVEHPHFNGNPVGGRISMLATGASQFGPPLDSSSQRESYQESVESGSFYSTSGSQLQNSRLAEPGNAAYGANDHEPSVASDEVEGDDNGIVKQYGAGSNHNRGSRRGFTHIPTPAIAKMTARQHVVSDNLENMQGFKELSREVAEQSHAGSYPAISTDHQRHDADKRRQLGDRKAANYVPKSISGTIMDENRPMDAVDRLDELPPLTFGEMSNPSLASDFSNERRFPGGYGLNRNSFAELNRKSSEISSSQASGVASDFGNQRRPSNTDSRKFSNSSSATGDSSTVSSYPQGRMVPPTPPLNALITFDPTSDDTLLRYHHQQQSQRDLPIVSFAAANRNYGGDRGPEIGSSITGPSLLISRVAKPAIGPPSRETLSTPGADRAGDTASGPSVTTSSNVPSSRAYNLYPGHRGDGVKDSFAANGNRQNVKPGSSQSHYAVNAYDSAGKKSPYGSRDMNVASANSNLNDKNNNKIANAGSHAGQWAAVPANSQSGSISIHSSSDNFPPLPPDFLLRTDVPSDAPLHHRGHSATNSAVTYSDPRTPHPASIGQGRMGDAMASNPMYGSSSDRLSFDSGVQSGSHRGGTGSLSITASDSTTVTGRSSFNDDRGGQSDEFPSPPSNLATPYSGGIYQPSSFSSVGGRAGLQFGDDGRIYAATASEKKHAEYGNTGRGPRSLGQPTGQPTDLTAVSVYGNYDNSAVYGLPNQTLVGDDNRFAHHRGDNASLGIYDKANNNSIAQSSNDFSKQGAGSKTQLHHPRPSRPAPPPPPPIAGAEQGLMGAYETKLKSTFGASSDETYSRYHPDLVQNEDSLPV